MADIETHFYCLVDRGMPPWAVVAFDAVAGMVMWYPVDDAWIENSEFLAPYIVGYEPGGYRIDRHTAERFLADGVGPARKAARWLSRPDVTKVDHLPRGRARRGGIA